MGYGEFGGGGSVDWVVVHSDKKQKGKDKDPDPTPGSGGKFYVLVDHDLKLTVDLDGHDIMVVWSPTTVADAVRNAPLKKTASTGSTPSGYAGAKKKESAPVRLARPSRRTKLSKAPKKR